MGGKGQVGARSGLQGQYNSATCHFKAKLSRLGEVAKVAGVQLAVPGHLQMQLATGSMLVLLSLRSNHRAHGASGKERPHTAGVGTSGLLVCLLFQGCLSCERDWYTLGHPEFQEGEMCL